MRIWNVGLASGSSVRGRLRDPAEADRGSSPLELFTDLCFVVAGSQAAAALRIAQLRTEIHPAE